MDSFPTFRRALRHPFTRLVLCILLALALSFGLAAVMTALRLPSNHLEVPGALFSSLRRAAAWVLALLLIGRWLEGRGPAQLGLGWRGAPGDLGRGALLGAGLMSAVVAVLALAGWYRLVEGPPETAWSETGDALTWAVIFTVAGFFEEVAFRGVVFRLLEEWLGSAAALLISSAFFGLLHGANPHATWFATLAIALEAGLLLGGAYMLTRSLWFATGLHLAWNWTQGALFGVAVSGTNVASLLESRLVGPELWTGGAFGAEASGVALLLCTAAGVAMVVYAARRGQWIPFMPRRRARQQQVESPAPAA